jgi:hypothetical protein
MKYAVVLSCLLCIGASFVRPAQRHITLRRKKFLTEVPEVAADTADKALRIATYLLNSKEFQDSIAKLTFKYSNHCKNCGAGVRNRSERIPAAVVLDSLFSRPVVDLILDLHKVGDQPRNGKCFGLGATCPATDSVTSYFANIECDMSSDIPFSYAYSVHICHEFMHDVGYCHTDHQDGVAEEVGWIAFYFINKWYHEHDAAFLAATG